MFETLTACCLLLPGCQPGVHVDDDDDAEGGNGVHLLGTLSERYPLVVS